MEIQVKGVRLYCREAGQGSPLLLVHGNGESQEIFREILEPLGEKYHVYAPDSRCHGRSQQTEEISYDSMAEDLIGLIRQLKLEKPVFYGFSDGGILGLLIAIREPELLGKLIISGANLNPRGLKLKTRLEILREALGGSRLSRMMLLEPHISRRELRRIKVPTVVLAGQYDVIRRSHTRAIAENIPGSQLRILPGENHGSYIVGSRKLLPLLEEYI